VANGNAFTPVQRRMMAVLADGLPHTSRELHACLEDDLGPLRNIAAHLTAIRKVLRPRGEDILTRLGANGTTYLHVRLLPSPSDGRT
jgi:hypothetical protein